MAIPIYVPRINNNDDEVKLVELSVTVGDRVGTGQAIAAVETDKALVDIEAPTDGFILAICGKVNTTVQVGSVLMWTGTMAGEAVPDSAKVANSTGARTAASVGTPTAKALALLRDFGLAAGDVTANGDRLSANDVLRHVAAQGTTQPGAPAGTTPRPNTVPLLRPEVEGTLHPLLNYERGMLHTVSWQRDVAVPGYLEMAYDHSAWEQMAAAFGQQRNLLLNPLLPLMSWQLVELAAQTPRYNATLVGEQRHEYNQVNLGFTVQAGAVLYLAVVRDAAALGKDGFVSRLVDLQRRAASHALMPQELQGATIGFSTMSRWKVACHVPVLAPHTALMVAHTVGADGQGVLGATYDHRVLHGGEVATLLRKLAAPKMRD